MGRPSKPLISREAAVQAALDIIDEEGLDALSLQKIAKKLGVKAPSLYYHFKNKSELTLEVLKLILSEPPPKKYRKKHHDWKESMVILCMGARSALMRHPNAAPLMLEIYPERIMLPTYEHWFRQYDVPKEKKMLVSAGLESMVYGSALMGAMSRAQGIPPFPDDLDKERYPALAEAIKSNRLKEDKLFEESIRIYLIPF